MLKKQLNRNPFHRRFLRSWNIEPSFDYWLNINKKNQTCTVSLTHALLAISCLVLRKLGSQKLEACTLSLSYSVDVSLLRITEEKSFKFNHLYFRKNLAGFPLTKPLLKVRSCRIFTSNRSNFWLPGRVAAIHNELREVFAPGPPREPGNNGATQGNTDEISWGSMPPPQVPTLPRNSWP